MPSRIRHPRTALVAAALCAALLAPASHAAPRVGAGLERAIASAPDAPVAVWVFFTDRAGAERDVRALALARERLSPRSLERRALRGTLGDVTASDLPPHDGYVNALVARGATLRGTSRWLNAASVDVPPRVAAELAKLPFVARVDLVPRAYRMRPIGAPEFVGNDAARTAEPAGARAVALNPGDQAFYGGTFRQLDMMQVPAMHAAGLSGAGVLVCMLDGGFHVGVNQAVTPLNVVATQDFVHKDFNVDDQAGQDPPGESDHGTWTVACVAGNKPGTYMGGAYGASVALGKTEDGTSETPVEMDYWQFGAEWADSLGADVISSSLGYSEFDNPADSYTYADMDGRTTVVTLAAVEATRRGITVVNAAGNEGSVPWHFIIAPADADTVLSIGAVDSFNVVTSFSSRGPTSDGRIKPDLTAMGRSVLLPNPTSPNAYMRASGTSFATPLTSGVVALLLQAHPSWGPWEVREALRQTALDHAAPNNNIGWGLVQGLAARDFVQVAGVPPIGTPASGIQLSIGPNPVHAGAAATVRFASAGAGRFALDVIDTNGRRRARLYEGPAEAGRSVEWRAVGDRGEPLAPGVYWIRLVASDRGASAGRASKFVVLP